MLFHPCAHALSPVPVLILCPPFLIPALSLVPTSLDVPAHPCLLPGYLLLWDLGLLIGALLKHIGYGGRWLIWEVIPGNTTV